MPHEITRAELYKLVWSKPLRALAVEFEMSDVGLAKACGRAHVPRPPRGYWAKLAAGKKVQRTSLPKRAPGMSEIVDIATGGYYHTWRVDEAELLKNDLPPPPEFLESLEQVRADVEKQVGRVSVSNRLDKPHPLIAKLLLRDERIRQKNLERDYSWYFEKPVFDSTFEKRRLRILNAIFTAMAKLGHKPSCRGSAAGQLQVKIADTLVCFTLDKPGVELGRYREREPVEEKGAPLRLEISTSQQVGDFKRIWEDTKERKIGRDVRGIVISLIVAAEVEYRASCFRHREWLTRRKAELIEAERKRIEEEKRRERERQEKLEQARIDSLLQDADNLRRARTIRDYVREVQMTLGQDAKGIAPSQIQEWTDWALAQADRIDPLVSGRFIGHMAREKEDC